MRFPKGKTIDTRDLDSLAPAFKRGESRCGVYRLHFANGEAYCGQATNVIRRYSAHRRHHPDIVSIDFFPFAKARLNEAEMVLIRETESEMPLRNIMLTGRPRGDELVEILTSSGSTVALPWEQTRAKGAVKSIADAGEPKLALLLSHPAYPVIRSVVGWYIALTIPDPAATAGQLWTVSCLPSTNRTDQSERLLTISCGNLETLFVGASRSRDYANDENYFVYVDINTTAIKQQQVFYDPEAMDPLKNTGPHMQGSSARWLVEPRRYRSESVTRFGFPLAIIYEITVSETEFPALDDFIDAAYELNVRLMRRGSTMYEKYHSERLAELLIAEAAIWETLLTEEVPRLDS